MHTVYSVYFAYFFGSTLSFPRILLSLRFSYHYNSHGAKKIFCLFTADLTSISKVTSWNNLPYKKRFTKREVYAKDYCKADHGNVYCFFITTFPLAIPVFFSFTDVTEWFTGFQVYRCYERDCSFKWYYCFFVSNVLTRRKKLRSTLKSMHWGLVNITKIKRANSANLSCLYYYRRRRSVRMFFCLPCYVFCWTFWWWGIATYEKTNRKIVSSTVKLNNKADPW